MKKIVILFIALMVISVGFLSGCNEMSNDDEKFINKADIIIDDMYPVTTSNLYSSSYKATNYRLEIADYTLSSKCKEIRDELDASLGFIVMAYDNSQFIYPDYELISTYIDIANLGLEKCGEMVKDG